MINPQGVQLLSMQNRLADLEQKLFEAQKANPANQEVKVGKDVPKNQRCVRVSDSRKYVLLSKKMDMSGKVPQQQEDLASIISKHFNVNEPFSEQELWNTLVDQAGEYKSLYSSKQHITYLFAYYRGYDLKDGKHLSFIRRNFLRVIE